MKRLAIILSVIALLALPSTGCHRRKAKPGAQPAPQHQPAKPGQPPQPPKPGVVEEIQNTVDGMAGGAAFRAGEKAKGKIQNIQNQHNRQMEDALE